MVFRSPTTKNEKKNIIIIISNIGAKKADLSGGYRRGIFLQVVSNVQLVHYFLLLFLFSLKIGSAFVKPSPGAYRVRLKR